MLYHFRTNVLTPKLEVGDKLLIGNSLSTTDGIPYVLYGLKCVNLPERGWSRL
jgi:hypothetical protein